MGFSTITIKLILSQFKASYYTTKTSGGSIEFTNGLHNQRVVISLFLPKL